MKTCPTCGGLSEVVDSRGETYIWRRRRCKRCKALFKTCEVPVSDLTVSQQSILEDSLAPHKADQRERGKRLQQKEARS